MAPQPISIIRFEIIIGSYSHIHWLICTKLLTRDKATPPEHISTAIFDSGYSAIYWEQENLGYSFKTFDASDLKFVQGSLKELVLGHIQNSEFS